MSTNTTIGILAAGAFVILLGVALFLAVEFDGPGLAGIGIGAAVGVLNLVLGLWLTSRALRVGGKSVLRTMHDAGYRGDVYPALGMWELAPTGVFASYPFPESLNVMRSGGF